MAEFRMARIPIKRARLSDQVREILVDRVLTGELAPGAQLPPERSLAEAFGVSVPVIREAVGALVRANVVDRRQGRGTFIRDDALLWLRQPDRIQGSLAVVASWTHGYYFGPVYEQLTLAARANGWLLHLVCPYGIEGAEVADQVLASGVQGVVWVETYPPLDEPAFEAIAAQRPIVVFNFDTGGDGLAAVRNDDRAGGAMAVRHLLEQGHRRVCLVANATDRYPHRARLEGAREAVAAMGLPPETLQVFSLAGYLPTREERQGFREALQSCSGVFFASAWLLQHLHAEIVRDASLRPTRAAFVTYDDFADLEAWDPPVTCVRQPMAEMAEATIEMLGDLAHGLPARPADRVFAPELVVRRSSIDTRSPGGLDPHAE